MRDDDPRWILVVEDEEDIAQLLKLRLESYGFSVRTASNGKEAIRYATEKEPDLVILDVNLPDMSGYLVCRELRKRYGHWTPPILMLTAMDQPIDQLRGFAYGTDVYLTKPFDTGELMKTVGLLLHTEAIESPSKGNGRN